MLTVTVADWDFSHAVLINHHIAYWLCYSRLYIVGLIYILNALPPSV